MPLSEWLKIKDVTARDTGKGRSYVFYEDKPGIFRDGDVNRKYVGIAYVYIASRVIPHKPTETADGVIVAVTQDALADFQKCLVVDGKNWVGEMESTCISSKRWSGQLEGSRIKSSMNVGLMLSARVTEEYHEEYGKYQRPNLSVVDIPAAIRQLAAAEAAIALKKELDHTQNKLYCSRQRYVLIFCLGVALFVFLSLFSQLIYIFFKLIYFFKLVFTRATKQYKSFKFNLQEVQNHR